MTANASTPFLVLTKVEAGLQVVSHPRRAGIQVERAVTVLSVVNPLTTFFVA